MALEIRNESVGEILVLDLKGRLDTETSADLELAVQDLLETGARDFIISLAGVGYVSSAGLRVLLMLGKGVDGNGSLRLVGLNPTVRQVFDVAGFTQLFTILPDREAALAQKIRTATSKSPAEKPPAAAPAQPKPAPPRSAEEKPVAAVPKSGKSEPVSPAPAKPESSKSKEKEVESLADRVARVIGAKTAAISGPAMSADQVSRVARALTRTG